MKIRRRILLTSVALALLLAATVSLASAQSGSGYDLTWNTIDGGGGTSTNGGYSLSGTIGQADAGSLSSGTYSLAGGFWGGLSTLYYQLFIPLVRR